MSTPEYTPTRADVDTIRAYLSERYSFPSPDGLERLVALGLDARAASANDLRDFYRRTAQYLPATFFRDR